MLASISAGYNPNGFELTYAFGLILLLFGRDNLSGIPFRILTFLVVILASTPKPFSGIWPVLIILVYYLYRSKQGRFERSSKFFVKLLSACAILISTLLSLPSIFGQKPPINNIVSDSFVGNALRFFLDSFSYFSEYYGLFGIRDTQSAPWSIAIWIVCLSLLCFKFLEHSSTKRKLIFFSGLFSLLFILPLVAGLLLMKFNSIGLQSRYIMVLYLLALVLLIISIDVNKLSISKFISPVMLFFGIYNFFWVFFRFSLGLPNAASVVTKSRTEELVSGDFWFPSHLALFICCLIVYIYFVVKVSFLAQGANSRKQM
jgi:hypothetical protein